VWCVCVWCSVVCVCVWCVCVVCVCVCVWCACVCVCVWYGVCVCVVCVHGSDFQLPSMQSACACLGVPYFLHYRKNDTILQGKNVTEHAVCVLIFCTTFFWNGSHSKKNSARHFHECPQVFMKSARYCQILMGIISRQIFEKSSDRKFRENPFNGNRVPSGRTWS